MMECKESKTTVLKLRVANKARLIHLLPEQNHLLIEKYQGLEKQDKILQNRPTQDERSKAQNIEMFSKLGEQPVFLSNMQSHINGEKEQKNTFDILQLVFQKIISTDNLLCMAEQSHERLSLRLMNELQIFFIN